MDALRGELVGVLSDLRPQSTAIPIYSTVTGQLIDGQQLNSTYWGRNLREPVLFADVVQRSIADGVTTFIEMSPHPILLPAIEQSGAEAIGIVTLPSLRREEDERATLLRSLGALYAAGQAIDWQRLYPSGRCVSLPSYPWQRERFWFDPPKSAVHPQASKGIHSLPWTHTESALHPGTHWWTLELSLDEFPYLSDHRVRGAVVLPATAYIAMVLSAAHEAFGGEPSLRNVVFKEALVLAEAASATLQLVITLDKPGTASFQILSRQAETDAAAWTVNASGLLQLDTREQPEQIVIDCDP